MTEQESQSVSINLPVELAALEKFCNSLIRRSRDIATTHDALITLESFITVFGKGAHGTEEYRAVATCMAGLCEKTRQQLLEQRMHALEQALLAHDTMAITSIHTPMSRNGFHRVLQEIVVRLGAEELDSLRAWSRHWLQDARQRSEEASIYPDVLNFSAAGIKLEEYQAMQDVNRVL